MKRISIARCRSNVCHAGSTGLSERPKPIRSGATTRSPAAVNTGIMWRYRYAHDGLPCRHSAVTALSRGAFVEVVDAHALEAGQIVDVLRRPAKARQLAKALVRCAQDFHAHPADQSTSNTPAAPMPPPMHIVTHTRLAPRRLPSISAWPVRRWPLTP